MSEITRESLRVMGFVKGRGGGNRYTLQLENGYFSVDFGVMWHKTPQRFGSNRLGVEIAMPHIRTLPQLRQLIRSLFGDDALPRRELSTITDEEAMQCIIMQCGEAYKYDFIRESDFVSIFDTANKCYNIVFNFTEGTAIYYQWGDEKPIDNRINPYLTNVCDFNLPAFHGDKGGKQ